MPIIGFFPLNALLLEEAGQAHRKVCSEHSPVSCNQSAVGSACPHSVSTGLPQWWSQWDPFPSATWWRRKGRTEVCQRTPAGGRDDHEVKQEEQRWEHNLHSISVTAMACHPQSLQTDASVGISLFHTACEQRWPFTSTECYLPSRVSCHGTKVSVLLGYIGVIRDL